MAEPQNNNHTSAAAAEESVHELRLRILVIEDEAAHAELIQRLLRRNAYWNLDIEHRHSYSSALPLLMNGAVDVVLTDLDLPDTRGLDTLQAVREQSGDVPVLVLTSTDDNGFGRLAVQSGADDYLVKSDLSSGLLTRAILYAIERRKSRRRIRQATQELKRNIRDLTDFARIISHDLKTPLAVIRMELDRAELSIGKADAQANMAEAVLSAQQELDFAVRLIDDLSKFARVGAHGADPQPLALTPLIRKAIDRATACFPGQQDSVEWRLSPPDMDEQILGHESMLYQLFENLFGNAIKYRSDAEPDIRVSVRTESGRVHITVSDNGMGIPVADRKRVLEMFERVSGRDQAGTGIGLAIASRIAEMHGESLTISDGHGEGASPGTAFHFSLPVSPR